VGGFGFATAQVLKLLGIPTGWQTNWHSLLEQTYGFINGIGIAVALFWLARRAPKLTDNRALRPWAEAWAAGFVLLAVTYLNLRKNPPHWVAAKAMPAMLAGLSAAAWFDLAYAALAIAFIVLLLARKRRPLALLPATWLGRGQLLYLAFLWCMVLGNFERALVGFAPVRLVTEGVVFLNAVLCTVGLLLSAPREHFAIEPRTASWSRVLRLTTGIGCLAAVFCVNANWGIVRGVYGDSQAPGASKHIRFGPDATATKEKPGRDRPHP
jgi:hypothetical protein